MLRFGMLGKRMFQIMMTTMLACILLFGSVSFFTLLETVHETSHSTLETFLMQLVQNSENDYQSLLFLSQQMTAAGPVGMMVNEYLHAADPYEQGATKRSLIKVMSTFAGLQTELVMYYDVTAGTQVFSNLIPEVDFTQYTKHHSLYSNQLLSYNAIHESYNRISAASVVSLVRTADFDDDVQYTIYIENRCDIPEIVEEISEQQNVNYIFLQMNADGVVQYSTNPEVFPTNSTPEYLIDSYGYSNGYAYELSETSFGAQFALLAPKNDFNTRINEWINHSIIALIIIGFIIFMAVSLAYHYIFRGLRIFYNEIDKSICGSLEPSSESTRIDELDTLLKHFDELKANIKQTMAVEARREREQRKLEVEAITYQINPHFLFNTLNSIHWLAAMNKQKTIMRYIASLNTILSYNLGRTDECPTLRSEIEILRIYLEIEQGRHDFYVSISVANGEYLSMETPRLILQPIVENAIGHGIDDNGNLTIKIWPKEDEGIVYITVKDDGCGIKPEALEQLNRDVRSAKGIGFRYVRTMIKTMYGDRASIHIQSEMGKGTCVTLKLPLPGKGTAE